MRCGGFGLFGVKFSLAVCRQVQLPVEIGARGKEVAGCVGREWGVVEQLFEREGTNDGRVTAPRTDVLARMRPAGAAKGGASSEKTRLCRKRCGLFAQSPLVLTKSCPFLRH